MVNAATSGDSNNGSRDSSGSVVRYVRRHLDTHQGIEISRRHQLAKHTGVPRLHLRDRVSDRVRIVDAWAGSEPGRMAIGDGSESFRERRGQPAVSRAHRPQGTVVRCRVYGRNACVLPLRRDSIAAASLPPPTSPPFPSEARSPGWRPQGIQAGIGTTGT